MIMQWPKHSGINLMNSLLELVNTLPAEILTWLFLLYLGKTLSFRLQINLDFKSEHTDGLTIIKLISELQIDHHLLRIQIRFMLIHIKIQMLWEPHIFQHLLQLQLLWQHIHYTEIGWKTLNLYVWNKTNMIRKGNL